MTLPAFLPDWVPAWVGLVIVVGAVLVVGAYAAMPFSVFGVKRRLEGIEDRLDELASDLRALAHRLPDPEMRNPAAWRRGAASDDDEFAPPPVLRRPPPAAPPAPVAAPPAAPRVAPAPRPQRSEPQLNWPANRPKS